MTTRRALWGLIAVSGLLRLAWAASVGPGNDEAYHYLFLVHPDWGYFDHPPMLAAVESLGVALAGGAVTTFSLRLGFVLTFAGSTWLMARLASRLFGDRAGLLAAFGLNVSAYHTAAAGAFALPDGPLLFFWLLTLDRLAVALAVTGPAAGGRDGGSSRAWAAVGLAWGGAMLSKYHAVFLPAGALLYLAAEPKARAWLRRPGPYLAAAVGLAVFSPVLAWNASHGWASFAFQGGRAVGTGLRFDTPLAAVVLPAAYLFPWVWARLVREGVGRGRRLARLGAPAADRFLVCMALPPLAVFLAVSFTRPVLPHWTLVGFLPLFPMAGQAWARAWAADPVRFRRRAAFLALMPVLAAASAAAEARTGLLQRGRPGGAGLVDAALDPTSELFGWDQVADALKTRGLLGRPGTFLFTSNWYHSGQLAFATRGSGTPVLCYNSTDARSFAFWSRPGEWVGREGVLVAVNENPGEPSAYDRWFARIEPLATVPVVRSGAVVRTVRLFRCVRQTSAFPFDDLGRTSRRPKPPAEPAARVAARRPGQTPAR